MAESALRRQPVMRISLVYAPAARQCHEREIVLDSPGTVAQAIQASGWLQSMDGLGAQLASGELDCGVWGEKVAQERLLKDGDRVEIYRALKVDPKQARRLRFSQQGARSTGLFANRRPGAKPGY